MAKNNTEKEIRRAADGVKSVRTNVYLVGRAQAAAVLASGVVMLAALCCYTFIKIRIVGIVSLAVIGVSAAFVIALYAAVRAKGPLNYMTVCSVAPDGTRTVLQRLGRNKFVFAHGDRTVTYDRGSIAGGEIYREDLRWDWFADEEFEFVKNLNTRDKKYRSARGVLCLRDGEVYYAETGKARLRYSGVNETSAAIAVPADFYGAIIRVCPDQKQRAFIRADEKMR